MKKPQLLRKWFTCTNCKKKLIIYDNTAKSRGVFIKCKNCGKEIEIVIH